METRHVIQTIMNNLITNASKYLQNYMLLSTGMNVQAPYLRVKDQMEQMLRCTG